LLIVLLDLLFARSKKLASPANRIDDFLSFGSLSWVIPQIPPPQIGAFDLQVDSGISRGRQTQIAPPGTSWAGLSLGEGGGLV
jgi:hypothetical protein